MAAPLASLVSSAVSASSLSYSARLISADEAERQMKVISLWRDIYSVFPSDVTSGARICEKLMAKVTSSMVFVIEDGSKLAQAFARLRLIPEKALEIEEILVAPWNNSSLRTFLAGSSITLLACDSVVELAKEYGTSLESLTKEGSGIGALALYVSMQIARAHKVPEVTLISLRETRDYYAKLGLVQDEEDANLFKANIKDAIPKALETIICKKFSAF